MSHALPHWWFVLLLVLLALTAVLIGDALGGEPFRMPSPACPPNC